jgi:type IV pilus assembly protein PilC
VGSMLRGAKATTGGVICHAGRDGSKGVRRSTPRSHRGHIPGSRKIVSESLPLFSRKLAAMLSAGMPIVRVLKSLEKQDRNLRFKAVVAGVRTTIENGSTLSAALRQYPSVFDDLYVSMVACGESSGQVAETIRRLACFLEDSRKLRRRVKSAMMYPMVISFIAVIITTGMLLFIVPVFAGMFDSLDAPLPRSTQFLIDTSGFLKQRGIFIFLGIGALVFGFKKWRNSRLGGYAWDRLVLRVPVFGDLLQKVAAARFARTFAELVRGGVPMLTALEVVAGATGNRAAAKLVLDSRTNVEEGKNLSSALTDQPIFPEMVVEMLQAGEETGKVDEMMDCIADFYEEEVQATLDGLTALLEPMFMVVLGALIGTIVVCLFMPILTIASVI